MRPPYRACRLKFYHSSAMTSSTSGNLCIVAIVDLLVSQMSKTRIQVSHEIRCRVSVSATTFGQSSSSSVACRERHSSLTQGLPEREGDDSDRSREASVPYRVLTGSGQSYFRPAFCPRGFPLLFGGSIYSVRPMTQ